MKLYRGQTLVSLILAMALSTVLLFIFVRFFTQVETTNYVQLSTLALQRNLETRLDQIAKDIRRSGFQAINSHLINSNISYFQQNNQWKALQINAASGEMPQSCILFFYDLDQSGCIGGKNNQGHADDRKTYCVRDGHNIMRNIETELFGYRLYRGTLQIRSLQKKDVDPYCSAQDCTQYTAPLECNVGKWESLFDDNKIRILSFYFTSIADGRGLRIFLKGALIRQPKIQYETYAIVPLINLERENE